MRHPFQLIRVPLISLLASLLLASTVVASPAFQPLGSIAQVNVKSFTAAGIPEFVTRHFDGAVNAISEAALRSSAKSALHDILIEHFRAAGNEEMVVSKVFKDKGGALHVRFDQGLNGLPVAADEPVNCNTSCNNGHADLYLRFGAEAEANPNSANNECGSYSSISNESCTTGPAPSADTLYAAVHAYAAYTHLTITCTINAAAGGSCSDKGASCTTGADCCSGSCGGRPGSKSCR